MVLGRSPGEKAEYQMLTTEGQKGGAQCTGSCDEERITIETKGYKT
jgi:hypothetical protein